MTPERFRRVDQLVSLALERAANERAEFIREACAGEEDLRLEVESLLASQEKEDSFLAEAPVRLAAQLLAESAGDNASTALLDGEVAPGRYKLVEKLGVGGMGVVYLAEDPELGRRVAIKLMEPKASGTLPASEGRARLLREARALAQLSHPNVIAVHDVGTCADQVFIAMEYVEGSTLSQWLAERKRTWREVLSTFVQAGRGLAAAHAVGIVHRDFKPDNVLVGNDGRVRVLDFGLARPAQPSESEELANADGQALAETKTSPRLAMLGVTVTQRGKLVGTPGYMPPEQLIGGRVDEKTDQYSFCVALFQGLYGTLPFNADNFGALLEQIRQRKLIDVPKWNHVPSSIHRALLRGLSPNPADRFSSMEDLLEKLERQRAAPRAVVGAALVMGAVVVGALFYFQRAQALTETDYILLPEFVNTTGEPVFDGTLRQALAVKLQESPFLNVVSEERIAETLRFMGRAPDEWVTPSLAREICKRQEVKAMVSGQIAPLGRHYVIALNAVNCQTGDALARGQVEAGSKEEVLRALGKAASDLRRKLGESLSSIRKFDVPLEQATTTSLEALKAFALGSRERARGMEMQSVPLFRRAIELDPNFASAYGRLGQVYSNLAQNELGREYTIKAFELRDRVSEPERLYLVSHYYEHVTGDLEKAIETYQLWKQTYPRDWTPWLNLAARYNRIGMYDKAIAEVQEAIRLNPNHAFNYQILAWAYLGLNRFDEAKAICEQQISKGSDDLGVHAFLYYIAVIQGDATSMERQVEWAKGKENNDHLLGAQAGVAAFFGKLQRARELNQQSAEWSQRRNFKEAAATTVGIEAVTEAALGNSRLARERAASALALAPRGIFAQTLAGYALAISGQADQALALADELGKRFPQNTMLNAVTVPLIRASVELERGNATAAIELLQSAKPYQYGEGLQSLYFRGQAHLCAGAGREAAAEFQKVLERRGATWFWPVVYPLAQLGLARAHALAGDLPQSRKAYQDFFALWKDADPDIPILQEAKAEYAKLT